MGLGRQEKKYITSLSVKKYRDAEACFVVEGEKSVNDFIAAGFTVRTVYMTQVCNISSKNFNTVTVSFDEMQQISNLKTASPVLAVMEIPEISHGSITADTLMLALDDVQDPGNLGTIIRLADWFGIETVVCSPFTADAYGPKTVQATMGALAKVRVVYSDLEEFLNSQDRRTPVYGTFLDGEPVYGAELSQNGIILLGNEGKGISPKISRLVTKRLYIPPFGDKLSESLNVAIAAAIICSEFRRRI